jgi:hypothetical protein
MGILRTLGLAIAGSPASLEAHASESERCVLNVGGNDKKIPIPTHYTGWTHLLLDIDPTNKPDIICDARKLTDLPAARFDAIYCSHNLEHYYRHDGRAVLAGFRHVLKQDGFAEIRVPDIFALMKRCVSLNLDLEDVLWDSGKGLISVHDVIYGWGKQIEESGVDFYAHKAGFSAKSLGSFLLQAGFANVLVAERNEVCELSAFAFMIEPTPAQRELLHLD